MSFGAAIDEIAAATGRDIAYRPVSSAEYATHATRRGLPAEFATALNVLFG